MANPECASGTHLHARFQAKAEPRPLPHAHRRSRPGASRSIRTFQHRQPFSSENHRRERGLRHRRSHPALHVPTVRERSEHRHVRTVTASIPICADGRRAGRPTARAPITPRTPHDEHALCAPVSCDVRVRARTYIPRRRNSQRVAHADLSERRLRPSTVEGTPWKRRQRDQQEAQHAFNASRARMPGAADGADFTGKACFNWSGTAHATQPLDVSVNRTRALSRALGGS
ncbi:hypothetical protein DES52_11844 [Deinococcus yavapaiensis KR-236]|uniref:Uncharacterized protein n=1 Tax=Deinococcus yavapaiensis KR-236 TaxID=694435 RepID=A0A318S2W4_9DEIO|nr:hypothetical protein DES52_11844 [Deinococcus yavapaiensis KR-236]